MKSDIFKEILDHSEIAYARCLISFNQKGEPIEYQVLEASCSFLRNFDLIEKEFIGRKINADEDSFNWLSFFSTAFRYVGSDIPIAPFKIKNTNYNIKSFLEEDNLYITMTTDKDVKFKKQNKSKIKSKNMFELLYDNMLSGCAIYSIKNEGKTPSDCTVEAINKAGIAIERKSKSELVGKTLGQIRKHIEKTPVMDQIRQVMITGKSIKLPPFHYNYDGYDDYYENVMFKISKNKVVVMYNDVTNRVLNNLVIQESKNELMSYIENAPYGIFVSDMIGTILEANNQLLVISGYSNDEIIGNNLLDFVLDSDKKEAMSDLLKERDEKEIFESEYKCKVSGGEIRNWCVSTVKLDDNKFIGFVNDITSKRILEDRITRSEKEFRLLFDNAGAGIVYFGLDGKIVLINRLLASILGKDSQKITGKSVHEVFPKDEADKLINRIKESAKVCETQEYEDIVNGEKNVLSTYNCMFNTKGSITGVAVIFVDITELRNSQVALKQSQERFKLLFEDAPLGYQSLDEQGILITANKAWLEMLGYEKKEAVGKPFSEFITPDYVAVFKANFPKFKYLGATCVNFEMLKKTGEKIKVRIDGRVSKNSDGSFKQTHCIVQDVTAQLYAEQKLVESEKRYSSMIENISDVIFITDLDRKIKYASPNVLTIFGWESEKIFNKEYTDFIHPDDFYRIDAQIIELEKNYGSKEIMEFRAQCANGRYKYIHLEALNLTKDKNINGILSNFHDITDRVLLAKQNSEMDAYVRNQQKLQSIGTLASGVAHEINNPINGIMNYSQVIIDNLDDKSQAENCAKEIIHEAERVSDIVQNLLGFSRPNQVSFEDVDVKEIIEQTLSLVRATVRHDRIDLQLDIPDDLPNVRCRSSQIQQVIMNLVTNARDSLNAKYPGTDKNKILNIIVKQTVVEENQFIRITIEDLGTGIPTTVQNRIFDPFFTTKSRDKGTGLGLAISYSIAKEHKGSITFDTKVGEYTRFHLDLPIKN